MNLINRLAFNMFMSLFFLTFAIITFSGAHFYSKKTRPNKNLSFVDQNFLSNDIAQVNLAIKNWVKNNKNLSILEQGQNFYLISESSSFLSYGFFYHISISPNKNSVKLNIAVQAKLVSSHYDQKFISKKLKNYIELKNVG